MAELFGIDRSGISRHISNIYKEGELQSDTTCAKIAHIVNKGIRGEVEELVDFYNLDVIIAVGYRVNSIKATRFRQWATMIHLSEKEIRSLERTVTSYFDYIESQIERVFRTKGLFLRHKQRQKQSKSMTSSIKLNV
jgi:hypothetical protein